jgi:hypothetical protein
MFLAVVLTLDCVQLLLAAGLRPFISAVLNMLEIMVAALDLAITVVVLLLYKLKLDLVGTVVQSPVPGIEVSPSCCALVLWQEAQSYHEFMTHVQHMQHVQHDLCSMCSM